MALEMTAEGLTREVQKMLEQDELLEKENMIKDLQSKLEVVTQKKVKVQKRDISSQTDERNEDEGIFKTEVTSTVLLQSHITHEKVDHHAKLKDQESLIHTQGLQLEHLKALYDELQAESSAKLRV